MTQDEFIAEARQRHGDRYSYAKTVFAGSAKKVTITCKVHGDFETLPHIHLTGSHCRKCSGKAKLTQEEFVEKAKSVHGERYDYSKAKYKNNSTKVEVICPEHGSFYPTPINHIGNKSGCPACKKCQKTTLASFIEKAKAAHGEKYDYSRVTYKGVGVKVEIICPEHGSFWQVPFDHVKGRGCASCGVEKSASRSRRTLAQFIGAAKEFHGERFDYSRSIYINSTTPIEIICHEHGSFWQAPQDHITRYGCRACSGLEPITLDEFLQRSAEAHGQKYDYSTMTWNGRKEKVSIKCPIHGAFQQTAREHMEGSGCQACAREQTSSAGENELAAWFENIGVEIVRNDRNALSGFEIDIFIPGQKIGIEFNGAYWHSEDKMQHPRLHETKAARAVKAKIQLITVWDFDWETKQNLVKKLILHRLNLNDSNRINARTCEIKQIDSVTAGEFYDETHIQGAPGRIICSYGLFAQGNMIACMSFSQASSRRGKTGSHEWELIRFSTQGIVRGGASRLFRAFVKHHNPDTIWSFSDRQHFNGGLYEVLGFEENGKVAADYRVYHQASGLLWHKSAWQRKHIQARLNELGIDETYDAKTDSRTEKDMQRLARTIRVMDSGKIRWKWQKKP